MSDGGLLWQVAAFLVAAGAVYGGIRNDIKSIHEQIAELKAQLHVERRRINECGIACGFRRRSTDEHGAE